MTRKLFRIVFLQISAVGLFLFLLLPSVTHADDIKKVERLIHRFEISNPFWNASRRFKIVRKLGEIGDSASIEGLISILGEVSSYTSITSAASNELVKIGSPAVNPLTRALEDENPNVRANAVVTLSKIQDTRAVQTLNKALSDDDLYFRRVVIFALAKAGDSRAIPPLIELLEDEEVDLLIRGEAASALGEFGDTTTIEPLINVLKLPYVKREAVRALGKMGEPAVKPVLEILREPRWGMRESAISILGIIEAPRTVKPLIDIMQDERLYIRMLASRVLGSLTGEELGFEYDTWQKWWSEQKEGE